MRALSFCIYLFLLLLGTESLSAQRSDDRPIHILFLLDGSGSMKDEWKGRAKFEIAKNILFHLTDSIESRNENIEFALRVFGHQYPFRDKVCDDSSLEVPFSKTNATAFKTKLNSIEAQGWTPIAYTLQEALSDFKSPENLNFVILITDGDESCDGDPCEAAGQFHKNNIALKPYIVGLGLETSLEEKFNCVGNYTDASDSSALSIAIKSIIKTSLKETTAEIKVETAAGRKISELPITFTDHYSGELLYSFVHTEDKSDQPDTLRLNPRLSYDITLHTTPPIHKRNFVLEPGAHNSIDYTIEEGRINVKPDPHQTSSSALAIVRSADSKQLIKVLETSESTRIIAGSYYVELLTLPVTIIPEVKVHDYKITHIKVPKQGNLRIDPGKGDYILSLYEIKEGERHKRIYERKSIEEKKSIKILPGAYYAVWRSNDLKISDLTKQKRFIIKENGITSLKL